MTEADGGADADRGDEKPLAVVITLPSVRPTPPSRPLSPEAWPVPRWLTATVLRIAIPHSPLAWGSSRGGLGSPRSAATAAAAGEPATVGFAELEAAAPANAAPADAAPESAASAPPAAAPAPVEPDVAPSPLPTSAAAAEPAAAAAHPAESLAQSLRRGIADSAAARDFNGAAADRPPDRPPDRPLPRSAGEARPGVRQLRAERPLGAPQAVAPRQAAPAAASDTVAAPGLPAANPPSVMVEPLPDAAAAAETALAMRPSDRPGDRPAIRNRRLYRRVAIDAGFAIDGAATELLDLSMGGFAAAKAPTLAAGMNVPVKLQLSIDGVDISSAMRASMVYCAEPRSGGRFIDLTASQTALLRYIVTWRGQAVGAIGTTTLLDAITRWPEQAAPSAPALPPVMPERRQSWWSRALGWLRGRSAGDQ